MAFIKRLFSKTIDGALNLTQFGIGTFIVFEYVGGFVVCIGPSMEPTIWTKDVLLTVNVWGPFGWGQMSKGDVIVARSPLDRQSICKRIVGVAGDQVKFHGNVITIPKDYVWLEGDNKFNSLDSREYGPVPVDLIRRRCCGKIYPAIDFKLDPNECHMDSNIDNKFPEF